VAADDAAASDSTVAAATTTSQDPAPPVAGPSSAAPLQTTGSSSALANPASADPTGTLTNVGQDDWIAVSLTANQAYEFTITGAGASIGLASNLSGATSAFSIDAANVGLSPSGTQYMYFMPAVSGTYYLDVSDAPPWPGAG
jgi:hypothetical protein